MYKRKFLIFMFLVMGSFALSWGVGQSRAAIGPNAGVNYNVPNFAYSPALHKFIDLLPGLCGVSPWFAPGKTAGINELGQCIPVATAQVLPGFPNDDYYEIALVEYREQLHSDLPPVTGTWPNQTGGTKLRGYVQEINGTPVGEPHYLGPLIIATKNKPVRIKFTNRLPVGAAGDLFLPVDTTIMGAGMGPNGGTEMYTQNRATLHLHGGIPGWVSDGTAHQWITPANEITSYPKGASQQNVPDMPLPSNGSATFHWTNQQGGRLMFYHDHAYGMTGPDVYAGEAAGYLLVDPAEESALALARVPTDLGHLIPLVIQDRTFVPATVLTTDPLWVWGGTGNLWFPHVYMPNQDPFTVGANGANPLGRWDYGAWFWPIFASGIPPQLSHVPEAFMDTPVVNGTAYPYLNVDPAQYRLRILNAANDRMLNLQLYVADPLNGGVAVETGGLTEVKMVPATPRLACGAVGAPSQPDCVCTALVTTNCFPAAWAVETPGMIPDILDSRPSGVPDPTLRGPAMIQIGTEGGILPAPALLLNTPVGFEQNKRNIVVLNVLEKTLFLAPAERADVIVDFSKFAGKTIILYNDSPAPVPASDPRYDFYTGNPDFSAANPANYQGGAPSTLPGFGPNTRTIMQFRVAAGADSSAPVDDYNPATLIALQTALPAAYALAQDRPVVAESAYGPAFGTVFPDQVAYIQTGSSLIPAWTFIDGTGATVTAAVPNPTLYPTPPNLPPGATIPLFNKAIQELFDPLGRMNATLGVELPFTGANNQTTVPLGFIDPTTETIPAGQTQIWKITHNGVDTHGIHFHLVNVQVINRVGWDGAVRPTDPNELGWKDTVRMNPLEDIIVAMRAKQPLLPFGLPESVRPLDVTMPVGSTFASFDPITGGPITVTNAMTNFGWEYTWHCHILGHEENDMMRPLVMTVAAVLPAAPTFLNATAGAGQVSLAWTDGTPFNYNAPFPQANLGNPANEIGFTIQRATNPAFTQNLTTFTALANATSYTDTTATAGPTYRYRVQAFNAAGNSAWSNVAAAASNPFPATSSISPNTAVAGSIGFTLTVNGSNFVAGSVVRWNAAPRPTTFVSATQLTAAIPATDIAAVGIASVTVFNPTPRGGTSNAQTFTITAAALAPAAPSFVRATGTRGPGKNDRVTLNWTDNANNETSFTIQRATNATFTTGLVTSTVGANTITFQTGNVPRNTRFYFRVRATNAFGSSVWVNAAPFPITTP